MVTCMILKMTDPNGSEQVVLVADSNQSNSELITQLVNLELNVPSDYVKLTLNYTIDDSSNVLTIEKNAGIVQKHLGNSK